MAEDDILVLVVLVVEVVVAGQRCAAFVGSSETFETRTGLETAAVVDVVSDPVRQRPLNLPRLASEVHSQLHLSISLLDQHQISHLVTRR